MYMIYYIISMSTKLNHENIVLVFETYIHYYIDGMLTL